MSTALLPTVLSVLAAGVVLAGVARWERGRPVTDGGFVGTVARAKPPGLMRVLTTVDHRDIGVLYIVFGAAAGLWGGTDAMMMRTELLTPGTTVWGPTTYNALFTTHGLTMLFFLVTPVFTGLANYFVPILVGGEEMAYPRINAIAFWLLPPAFLLLRAGLITEVVAKLLGPAGLDTTVLFALQPPATGWTLYVPLSASLVNPEIDLVLLGLHLSGVATTMAAINVIATVFAERSVGWERLDIFSWTMLTTSGIILFAFPLLGSALVMLLLDRNFGTTFYAVDTGGAILWQHLFWFFGHPEVYILVLPAFGLMSYILPKFCGRQLFGFKFVVYSTLAIGVLSFGVWAHHMFTTGIDPRLTASFMVVSLAIAIPSAVKEFNWIATMWNGRLRLHTPMVFCLGSLTTFVVGGVTGVFLAAIPVDELVHDTHYVVGHFHFIVAGIILMMIFAASYYWYPLFTGRMYHRRLGLLHGWLTIAGVFVAFAPLLLAGVGGHPRRYATYPEAFTLLHRVSSAGAFLLAVGVFVWAYNMVQSYRVGDPVTDPDVWNLRETGQFSREWEWFEARLRGADTTPPRGNPTPGERSTGAHGIGGGGEDGEDADDGAAGGDDGETGEDDGGDDDRGGGGTRG